MMDSLTCMDFRLREIMIRQIHVTRHHHNPGHSSNNGWPMMVPQYGESRLPPEVEVELTNKPLWNDFHIHTNEMIITKSGRRMFPSLQLAVKGLDKRAHYCVVLEMAPISPYRHKYMGDGSTQNKSSKLKGWVSAGPSDFQSLKNKLYLHPDSPATGSHWMQHSVNFVKLKLTNNMTDSRGNVVLSSMHKYVPRIWIIRCDGPACVNGMCIQPAGCFAFKETEFIAVTAYQNENITKLKINNNPFAKGFRDTVQAKGKKRKISESSLPEHESSMEKPLDYISDEDIGNESLSSCGSDNTGSENTVNMNKSMDDDERNFGALLSDKILDKSKEQEEKESLESNINFHRPWLMHSSTEHLQKNKCSLSQPLVETNQYYPQLYPVIDNRHLYSYPTSDLHYYWNHQYA